MNPARFVEPPREPSRSLEPRGTRSNALVTVCLLIL